jgi:hypothetical protein
MVMHLHLPVLQPLAGAGRPYAVVRVNQNQPLGYSAEVGVVV